MAMDIEPCRDNIPGLEGRHGLPGWATGSSARTALVLFSIVMFIGFVTWVVAYGPIEARSVRDAAPSSLVVTQGAPASDANETPTHASLAVPAEDAVASVEAAPVDGLKISSQSWRRGGLGSNAQVTFTLRNGNDYAVKDIELSCAFSRRDGSHLTDRTRTIHDTVTMRSRKTFARLHVGFVNINADKAKCSLIAANRI